MEALGKIQFNEDDPNHPDHQYEAHHDGGCPPSMGMFLKTIFHPNYLWESQAKSSSIIMTPTIRNLRVMKDILHEQVPDNQVQKMLLKRHFFEIFYPF